MTVSTHLPLASAMPAAPPAGDAEEAARPRPYALASTMAELRTEVARQAETMRRLEGASAGLESSVALRTSEVAEANARLSAVAREAVHRGGNLLAIVQAITRQTARNAVGLDDFVESLLGRLSSIALALRQVVVEEGADACDLARIVETQLQAYTETYPGRISLSGPPIPMRADAARMIGLAIHELATNAVKHGALATPGGRVDVAWRVTRLGAADMLDFRWLERASGRVPCATRADGGFGTLLLRTALPAQLRGTSVLDLSTDGLDYRFEAPLA